MSQQIRLVIGQLKGFSERKIKELTLAITANLVEDNPLDTGWSRANWVPRIGKPFDGVVGSRDAVQTGQQELGKAEVLTAYKMERGNIFISNSVPYVPALNDGHSKQAPAGFIQRAIAKGVAEVVN